MKQRSRDVVTDVDFSHCSLLGNDWLSFWLMQTVRNKKVNMSFKVVPTFHGLTKFVLTERRKLKVKHSQHITTIKVNITTKSFL